MKIGYARVSTTDQDPSLQLDALKKAGCEKLFVDHASGAKTDRPELKQCLSHLRKGDTLVVWRLDRLGRSLKHLLEIIEMLKEAEIAFLSVTEGFDTATKGGKLIFSIFGAISEFERNLTQERTQAGLAAARARGRVGGRKEKLSPKEIATLKKMVKSGDHPISEVAKTFKISRPSVYRYANK